MTFVRNIAAAGCLFVSLAASAAPVVSLGSVQHLYGTDAGRGKPTIMEVYHPGGQCDTLSAQSVAVTVKSNCNRFGDIFDFSSIDYTSIDHFEITLTFANARNQSSTLERWRMRGGYDYVTSGNSISTLLNASGTQTFTFANTNSLFNSMVTAEDFVLTFENVLGGTGTFFDLSSAKVELFGVAAVAAVPEPGSIALLGLGLAGLAVMRKRKQA